MTCQKQCIVTFVTEYTLGMERHSTFTKCLHKKVLINKCAMTFQPLESFSILATMMANTQIWTQNLYVHSRTHAHHWPPILLYTLECVRCIISPQFSLQTIRKAVLCMPCRGSACHVNVFENELYLHLHASSQVQSGWWHASCDQAKNFKLTKALIQIQQGVLQNCAKSVVPLQQGKICYVQLNQLQPQFQKSSVAL